MSLINLKSHGTNGFGKHLFSSNLISTSDCNDYIPIYAINGHELHKFSSEDNENELNILEYSLPILGGSMYYRYGDFIRELSRGNYTSKFRYKLAGVNNFVYMFRGILYSEQNEVLMCLAIKTDYLLNNPVKDVIDNPDKEKLVLFISNVFNEDRFKSIKKKLDIEYISKLQEEGIDVIHTTRINSWLFKNNFKPPKFKSVIEMNKHLKEDIPEMILGN